MFTLTPPTKLEQKQTCWCLGCVEQALAPLHDKYFPLITCAGTHRPKIRQVPSLAGGPRWLKNSNGTYFGAGGYGQEVGGSQLEHGGALLGMSCSGWSGSSPRSALLLWGCWVHPEQGQERGDMWRNKLGVMVSTEANFPPVWDQSTQAASLHLPPSQGPAPSLSIPCGLSWSQQQSQSWCSSSRPSTERNSDLKPDSFMFLHLKGLAGSCTDWQPGVGKKTPEDCSSLPANLLLITKRCICVWVPKWC